MPVAVIKPSADDASTPRRGTYEYCEATAERKRFIMPRRTGYVHRPLIAVIGDRGMLEDGTMVDDLGRFACHADGHIWITHSSSSLYSLLKSTSAFSNPAFRIHTVATVDTENPDINNKVNIGRFGVNGRSVDDPNGNGRTRNRRKLHFCWDISVWTDNYRHIRINHDFREMMEFALEVRSWFREQDLPLTPRPSGAAGALMRDSRFWNEPRGMVPLVTNEKARRFFPGGRHQLRAKIRRLYHHVIAYDMRGAYHQSVQTAEIPSPNDLYAYGYFQEDSIEPTDTSIPVYAPIDSEQYQYLTSRPGLSLMLVDRPLRAVTDKRFILPQLNFDEDRRIVPIYHNQLSLLEQSNCRIYGIVAAWVSDSSDAGIARYGKYAITYLGGCKPARKQWLKPVLHSVYGLFAARPRTLTVGSTGNDVRGIKQTRFIGTSNVPITVAERSIPLPSRLTNTVAYGVIQAEMVVKTLELANSFIDAGIEVLYAGTDAVHIRAPDTFPPTVDEERWSVEHYTNQVYYDMQSWVNDQGKHLPGRMSDGRAAYEAEQHRVRLVTRARRNL